LTSVSVTKPEPYAGSIALFWRQFIAANFTRRRLSLWLGVAALLVLTCMALFAPYLGAYDPNRIEVAHRLQPPSAEYWFGTDSLGRDLYSRILYGARVSLMVGLSVAALSTLIGVVIGLIAGSHRIIDMVVMRVVDGFMSVPPVLLAIALMALWGASVRNVIVALTIADAPRVVRLMRSVVLSAREEPYVDAAVTSGTKAMTILWRHILPNTFAPILVQATYIFASAMLAEAALSFIGAGVPANVPSWGSTMSEGRVLWQLFPHIVFIPALFLSLAVLAVNTIGDGLRDALDPRLVKKL
jgi:peptide/nickel transport system permease protein